MIRPILHVVQRASGVCLATLVFASAAQCLADDAAMVVKDEGRNYVLETRIGEGDMSNSPSWKTDDENPPLSPRRAAQIAKDYLKSADVRGTTWTVEAVSLTHFSADKWYYEVTFFCTGPSRAKGEDWPPQQVGIRVLMSGKVATALTLRRIKIST
jgi:hypothetical protein